MRITWRSKDESSRRQASDVYTELRPATTQRQQRDVGSDVQDAHGLLISYPRPDLADRAVFLTLESIPEERRWPEQELWAAFEAERPRLLGAVLDAAVIGLCASAATSATTRILSSFAAGMEAASPATGQPNGQ
jgi:hypothetical protein